MTRAALTATLDRGSFHYESQFTSMGQIQTTVGDAGVSSGKQVITIGSTSFTVIVIGKSCYFQGGERQMVDQLGLPVSIASAHAGQWISLAPGDLPYQSVYVAVTTQSALNSNIAFAPHQLSGTERRAGYRVLGITGPMTNQSVNGELQRVKGTAHLYVTASVPHLPVEYTENGKIDKMASKLVMTFSRWGEPVARDRPPGGGHLRVVGGRERHDPDHGTAGPDRGAVPSEPATPLRCCGGSAIPPAAPARPGTRRTTPGRPGRVRWCSPGHGPRPA